MKIHLTVISAPSSGSPITGQALTLKEGESIGRASGNQLILVDDDRVISSKHAEIMLQGDQLALVDQSTNGTFHNNNPQAIGKDNIQPLNTGDLITIGDYQFSVEVNMTPSLPEGLETVGFLDQAPTAPNTAAITEPPVPEALIPNATADNAIDNQADDYFDQWLEPAANNQSSEPWANAAVDNLSGADPLLKLAEQSTSDPLAVLDKEPSINQLSNSIDDNLDDDWWQTEPDNVNPNQLAMPVVNIAPEPKQTIQQPIETQQPIPVPEAQIAPAKEAPAPPLTTTERNTSPQSIELAELLGLKDLSHEQHLSLLTSSAGIIRNTTDSLVSLLRSRASIKNELRASRTMIQTTENNPLKFSAGAEDALQAMFVNASDAFLSPERAIEESFEDIADHQIAVLYAMKSAFNEMLGKFQPNELAMKFNTTTKGLLGSGKAKTWDRYCEYYEQLHNDLETGYNELFGEAFAEAYEAKLAELKISRSLNRKK